MTPRAARFFSRWIFSAALAAVVFTAVAHILGTTPAQVITADTQQILHVSHLLHYFWGG